MEQMELSRKGRHLTSEERVVIERMSRGGRPLGTSRPCWGDTWAALQTKCNPTYSLRVSCDML